MDGSRIIRKQCPYRRILRNRFSFFLKRCNALLHKCDLSGFRYFDDVILRTGVMQQNESQNRGCCGAKHGTPEPQNCCPSAGNPVQILFNLIPYMDRNLLLSLFEDRPEKNVLFYIIFVFLKHLKSF